MQQAVDDGVEQAPDDVRVLRPREDEPAIAPAAIITSAYSAVLWPASERSERCTNEYRALDNSCNTNDLQVDDAHDACERVAGKAGGQRLIPATTAGTTVSSAKAGRTQPTSGKQRRTGTVRARASARRRRSARSSRGKAGERGRGRRSQARARAQRLCESARAGRPPAELAQCFVERLAVAHAAQRRVELAPRRGADTSVHRAAPRGRACDRQPRRRRRDRPRRRPGAPSRRRGGGARASGAGRAQNPSQAAGRWERRDPASEREEHDEERANASAVPDRPTGRGRVASPQSAGSPRRTAAPRAGPRPGRARRSRAAPAPDDRTHPPPAEGFEAEPEAGGRSGRRACP